MKSSYLIKKEPLSVISTIKANISSNEFDSTKEEFWCIISTQMFLLFFLTLPFQQFLSFTQHGWIKVKPPNMSAIFTGSSEFLVAEGEPE